MFFEIKIPGTVVPGAIGLVCFLLLFLGHKIIGLGGYLEMALFFFGVFLLAVEIFILPGFGFLGLAGIFTILVSLLMTFTHTIVPRAPWEVYQWENALMTVLIILAGTTILGTLMVIYIGRYLPQTPFLKRLILAEAIDHRLGSPTTAKEGKEQALLNARGVALTALRPSGKALIEGKTFDVVTEGDWIAAGKSVMVVQTQGIIIVVRQVESVKG